MELNKFAAVILEGVQNILGKEVHASVITSVKNNSVERTGILFEMKDAKITPKIYIDDLYLEYMENNMKVGEIVEEVIDRYKKSVNAVQDFGCMSIDYDTCKERIIYRLVSRERNKALLEHVPYIPFMDMAITFHLIIKVNSSYIQSLKIGKDLQKKWNISTSQLYKLAKQNTKRILPEEIGELNHFVAKYMNIRENNRDPEEDLTNKEKIDMIVVSNEFGLNGASVILYDGVVEKIAEKYDSDLYLIPSSIHEMIVIPAKNRDMYDLFQFMLTDINEKFVGKEEILSDKVYIYNKNEKKFI